jgi:hypothetical protein
MTRTPQEEYNRYQAGNKLFGRNETATKVLREIWERDNPTPRETVVRLEVTVHHHVHHVVHHAASSPDGDVTAPAPPAVEPVAWLDAQGYQRGTVGRKQLAELRPDIIDQGGNRNGARRAHPCRARRMAVSLWLNP